MAIESTFDVPLIAHLAMREKQIQQNYRPYIQVHKWFARRPGTLFRGLILAEFADGPLRETFFRCHKLDGISVADPFMGGGTPLVEANRLGADVVGYDINPMSWWIVGREIECLDIDAYRTAAAGLIARLEQELGDLYRTDCDLCGSGNARVKCFLWVMTAPCNNCGATIDLFPGYLIAKAGRHPRHVLLCSGCGGLNEVDSLDSPGRCGACSATLGVAGPARRGSVECGNCGAKVSFPVVGSGRPGHRLFALEYHCPSCKPRHKGRFFKRPSESDLDRYVDAERRWAALEPRYVPDDEIPPGDESSRLKRWGYRAYRELFNDRQLLGLEVSCRLVAREENDQIRNALATNLSDLLRYNNMLVRYDTMALKALDIFSVHGFPVGLVRAEANLIGVVGARDENVGSGGWTNIVDKYAKAKRYCDHPFEIAPGKRRHKVYLSEEWIGDRRKGSRNGGGRRVDLRCGTATTAVLDPESLDAVFTDPPYYDSVQYAELMDFCYAWLRRLIGLGDGFHAASTRNVHELTGNATERRDLEHFTAGLSKVFQRMAVALKPGRPLVFTYHHNKVAAYYPVAVAILDAGFACTAALPCPAEMGGSIHINGTGSSVIDTILVCRAKGSAATPSSLPGADGVAALVRTDLAKLRAGGVKSTKGDIRCMIHGHLTRIAVARLLPNWNTRRATPEKLALVAEAVGDETAVVKVLERVWDFPLPTFEPQADLFEDSHEHRNGAAAAV